ncbi:hypothetical protein D9M68_368360 [compost metagenome]
MQDAYRPIVFQRQSHQLRAVMIDNQPWFVAHDFARLIGAHRPWLLPKRMDPHQKRVGVVKWQGELWIARRDLPVFMAAHDDPALSDEPSWKRMPFGDR